MLKIPMTDEECWAKYPKYRWVYETTKVLDSQNIKWSPFRTDVFSCGIDAITYGIDDAYPSKITKTSNIYTEDPNVACSNADIIIHKGKILWLQVHQNSVFSKKLNPDIELRIHALVILHFQKFSGIISVTTNNKNIYQIKLKPTNNIFSLYPTQTSKLLKKVY